MHPENVTTPFGRRPMTLGALLHQNRANEIAPDQSVDKWKVFRSLCEARPLLGISDRALAVLNALLSFYPGNILSAETGLVIFPSNAQLSIRAHGIAPATLRRHLSALIEAGLLLRKDSPNGKRYARRGQEGTIDQAYGFSIAPLIARAGEFEQLSAAIIADKQRLSATREKLTLCRRDITKLTETALAEGIPGPWMCISEEFRLILSRIPRAPTIHHLLPILEELQLTRAKILNLLKEHANTQKISGNESQTDCHLEESHPESIIESERPAKNPNNIPQQPLHPAQGSEDGPPIHSVNEALDSTAESAITDVTRSFPLSFVLKACPEIALYAPGGHATSWRDLMIAAVVVRTMLGVSAAAYEKACAIMGPESTAVVMACVLQRSEQIASPGGYLRDLTQRAERGEFSVGPMLMAQFRTHMHTAVELNSPSARLT